MEFTSKLAKDFYDSIADENRVGGMVNIIQQSRFFFASSCASRDEDRAMEFKEVAIEASKKLVTLDPNLGERWLNHITHLAYPG